jgi:hypothetical protein
VIKIVGPQEFYESSVTSKTHFTGFLSLNLYNKASKCI